MSAIELFEQLKALPAQEQEEFARLFHKLESPANSSVSNEDTPADFGNWPDFGARLKSIYGNKVAADSEAVISYARGDW